MQIFIYILSAVLTNYVFSMATTLLVVYGIEKSGGDPGSPGIMLFVLLCINGVLSIITAVVMGTVKARSQKVFPAKISALVFIFTYFPFHILGIYSPDDTLGVFAAPLASVSVFMLFFSYIPFYHATAQGLTNLYELVKKKEQEGIWFFKFVVLALIITISGFVIWFIFKPSPPPPPTVISLREKWELVESSGRNWQTDAYVQRLTLYPGNRLAHEISAQYLSYSSPEDIYQVEIDSNGNKVEESTKAMFSMRESAAYPIRADDWKLDSVEAWEKFKQKGSVQTCLDPSEENAMFFLALDRNGSGRLVWDLTISGCTATQEYTTYTLDAKTGQEIYDFFE